MTLQEVLNLETSKKNLRKVDTYLSRLNEKTLDYAIVNAYKAKMLYDLANVKEAITILLKGINNETRDSFIVTYTTTLIDIYLDMDDFSKALKYIELKNSHLAPLDKAIHTLDMIKFYAKKKDINNALLNIRSYLNDDISEKDKSYVLRLLLNYDYEQNNLIEFNEYYDDVLSSYKLLNDNKNISELYKMKLTLLYNNDKDECLNLINKIDTSNLTNHFVIFLYNLHIKLTIEYLDNLRKAVILDTNYEPFVHNNLLECKEEAKTYYLTTLELFNSLNNSYSISYVNNILKDLDNDKNKEKKEKLKSKFNDYNQVVIEQIIKEETKDNNKELKYITSDKDVVLVSKKYKELENVLNDINNIDVSLSYREILRLLLISFNKKFKFNESYLFNNSNKHGYHFKNDKLYDKTNFDFDLEKTINKRTIDLNKEILIHNLKDSYYNLSIVSGIDTIYNTAICFPLITEGSCFASIAFFFASDNIDDEYEYYKIFVSVISFFTSLISYNSKILNVKNTYNDLENYLPIGIKNVSLDEVRINDKAKEILNINSNIIDVNDFYNLLKPSSKSILHEAYYCLFNNERDEIEFEYELSNNIIIKEHAFKREGNNIVSYFSNISSINNKISNLTNYAHNSDFANVYSFKYLKDNYESFLSSHNKSLAFIKTKNINNYETLYGFTFVRDIIFCIARILSENKNKYEYEVFHFEKDEFIVIFNFNDKRKVNKYLNNLFEIIKTELNQINRRVHLSLASGIYKQSAHDPKMSFNDIIDFAYEALCEALHSDNNIVFYSNEIYDSIYYKTFYDELNLNEAIEKNKLECVYCPLYNLDNKSVLAYTSRLLLDNALVKENMLDDVIMLRNLEYEFDKYKIRTVLNDIKTFYKKTGYCINVIINLYSSTLTHDTFLSFLNEVFNYYKINSKFIYFKINGKINHSNVLDELKKTDFNIGVSSIDELFLYNLNTLYLDYNKYDFDTLKKYKSILSDKQLVLTNIENNSSLIKASEITNLVSGNSISKPVSITNLINQLKI